MRMQRFLVFGTFVVSLLVSSTASHAQTVASGPYYATPSWDQTLACTTSSNCPRFVVLANFGNNAVLDRETGLVWEKSPSELRIRLDFEPCRGLAVGSRQGWRVPTYFELRTLIDSSQSNPALPPGHPFTNLHTNSDDIYWTSTNDPLNPGDFLLVGFAFAGVEGSSVPDSAFGRFWCVRGPSSGGR